MNAARRAVVAALALLALLAPAAGARGRDTARYILPPGNYGGLPTTPQSRDQLGLYSALTPLRDRVSAGDLTRLFLPEDFRPIGHSHVENTGNTDLRLVYDAHGIPHVYGRTRSALMWGSGWATARDRGLLLDFGRDPARVAVADVPGVDAFSLVTSATAFRPSPQAEALVTAQRHLIERTYGAKGRQMIRDFSDYAAGVNAYRKAKGIKGRPFSANDVVATAAFIGSIFGAGGGAEDQNADLLAKLQKRLGSRRGHDAWADVMEADDPEAPTTTRKRFSYPVLTGGPVRGSVVLDAGSIQHVTDPAKHKASNFLVVNQKRSATRNSLAVMGPQLGYYYPEIVEQVDLHGPGIQAQGAAVPGLGMYILIGRTKDYAWSLTSANHDNRDVFAERLCEPGSGTPTRASTHYEYRGRCRAMADFDAGTLGTRELRFKTTVHGSVIGTATVHGRPYALARERSTFGRDGLNLAALKDMTEGRAKTPELFWKAANEFGFTFNWAYTSRTATSFFSAGRLPRRAPGLDRRLPTLGTGAYDWRGFLSERQHPHDIGGPGNVLINWNNKSAPGFMHGDDEHDFGSVQHVELFRSFKARGVRLPEVVGIMNRAASTDLRATHVWPAIRAVLATGPAPNARTARAAALVDSWSRRGGSRVDANGDGKIDDPAAAILGEAFAPMAQAVMSPVLGPLTDDLARLHGRDDAPDFGGGWYGYVDKDLRTLLGRRVQGRFHLRYCGRGSLARCRGSLWTALDQATARLAFSQGPDPARWRTDTPRAGFVPNLIPDTFPFVSRPTFQQVLEFAHP